MRDALGKVLKLDASSLEVQFESPIGFAADIDITKIADVNELRALIGLEERPDLEDIYLEKLTNKKPVVVHTGPSCDNPEDDIQRFDKVKDNDWIVSVDMIGEGVDIQRLRVLVYLPRARTELKFRQAMGRVVRKYEDIEDDDSTAYVVMPAFEVFDKLAKAIEQIYC